MGALQDFTESKMCFEIVRLSRFQNCSWFWKLSKSCWSKRAKQMHETFDHDCINYYLKVILSVFVCNQPLIWTKEGNILRFFSYRALESKMSNMHIFCLFLVAFTIFLFTYITYMSNSSSNVQFFRSSSNFGLKLSGWS